MKKLYFVILPFIAIKGDLIAAEAGMPQLDPEYWASQSFWLILVFSSLYLIMSKFFIPKIKNSLNDRENKIKNDLDEAKNLKDEAEKKITEYNKIIEDAKKEVQKIVFEGKKKLDEDLKLKKIKFETEIEKEIQTCQNEINVLKKNSLKNILLISEEITSNIIENLSGDKLNESSIKAAISETSKNKIEKYL
mgnify:FL=1